MAITNARGDALVRVTLDWRDGQHYVRGRQLPCRICGQPTNLRDAQDRPCDKTCIEREIEAQVLAFARTLIAEAAAGSTDCRMEVNR